jgi:hypothetical protein
MSVGPLDTAAAILTVLVAGSAAGPIVFGRGRVRRHASYFLGAAAIVAVLSWFHFGEFQSVYVDSTSDASNPHRPKAERHQPLHFHEFFHYYLGSKYFGQVGYLGLYDCTALADLEIAREDQVLPRVGTYVRDLSDVLTDKPTVDALAHCSSELRPRFTDARWASFKHDLRELRRLVPDDWWLGAVSDAGFNPPPSWVVLSSAVANVIPIRIGHLATYITATSLDVMLLLVSFLALRYAFGFTAAAMAAIYFGSSYLSSYSWIGGAFLRFTWLTCVILSLAMMKRGRWAWAGAFAAGAACDRLFPAAFAVGAMLPLVYRAVRHGGDKTPIVRFCVAFAGVAVALFVASTAVFGFTAWRVFFERILRHGDVYFVMHVGLKKIITYRDWVSSQDFHGHDGLARFRLWNLRLRATWAEMRPVVVPIQLLAIGGAVLGSIRARPYEAAVLLGVIVMFFFNLPANYYYSILVVVPALLLRRAATRPGPQRAREYVALAAFNAFWVGTLVVPRLWRDDIVYDFIICVMLAVFLAIWIAAWIEIPPFTWWRSLRSPSDRERATGASRPPPTPRERPAASA